MAPDDSTERSAESVIAESITSGTFIRRTVDRPEKAAKYAIEGLAAAGFIVIDPADIPEGLVERLNVIATDPDPAIKGRYYLTGSNTGQSLQGSVGLAARLLGGDQ